MPPRISSTGQSRGGSAVSRAFSRQTIRSKPTTTDPPPQRRIASGRPLSVPGFESSDSPAPTSASPSFAKSAPNGWTGPGAEFPLHWSSSSVAQIRSTALELAGAASEIHAVSQAQEGIVNSQSRGISEVSTTVELLAKLSFAAADRPGRNVWMLAR